MTVTKNILVVPVTWSGTTAATPTGGWAAIGTSVTAFYTEASYGQFTYSFTVTPTLTIPVPTTPPPYDLTNAPDVHDSIFAAATTAGYTPTSYDGFLFAWPNAVTGSPIDSGIRNPGGGQLPWYPYVSFNPNYGYPYTNAPLIAAAACHEFGHAAGFWETMDYYTAPQGTFPTPHSHSITSALAATQFKPAEYTYNASTYLEYGNAYCLMGGEDLSVQAPGHHSARHKDAFGWMSGRTQTVSANGSYTLSNLEAASPANPQALIVKSGGYTYWLEYRQPTGADAFIATAAGNGYTTPTGPLIYVLANGTPLADITDPHQPGIPNQALILDMGGVSRDNNSKNAHLPQGATFTAPDGMTITTTAHTSTTTTVTVTRPAVTKNVVVYPITWSGTSVTTPTGGWTTFLANVAAFYNEASYGQFLYNFTLASTITITTPADPTKVAGTERTAVLAAGVTAGFPLASYDVAFYSWPASVLQVDASPSGGEATVFAGKPAADLQIGISDAGRQSYVAVHELGHISGLFVGLDYFGGSAGSMLPHSHAIESDIQFVPNSPIQFNPARMIVADMMEYGNDYCTMGAGIGHFAARQKDALGWMAGRTQTVSTSGSYTISNLEAASPAHPQALIVESGGYTYWLEYRQPTGFDSFLGTSITTPITLTYPTPTGPLVSVLANGTLFDPTPPFGQFDQQAFLLDMIPLQGAPPYKPLQQGATFTAPDGMTITTTAHTSTTTTVTVTIPPLTVTISSGIPTQTTVPLTMTSHGGAFAVTGFDVYQALSGGSFSLIAVNQSSPYAPGGLTPNTQYDFKVKAVDSSGARSAAYSNTVSVTTASGGDTTPPSVPAGVSATASGSFAIDVGWTASTDNVAVTQYKVYRDGALFRTLGNFTTYHDAGLAGASTHTYHVSALDAALNESAQSAAATATTAPSVGVIERPGHHTGFHKWLTGWCSASKLQRAYDDGMYSVAPTETVQTALPYVVTFNVGSKHYYIEYRQPVGFDSHLTSTTGQAANTQGVLINMVDYTGVPAGSLDYAGHPSGRGPWLLDMTPNSAAQAGDGDAKDSALIPGDTYTDGSVIVTCTAASGASASVTISGLPAPPLPSVEVGSVVAGTRTTAGRVLPGGLVIPAFPKIMAGADDQWNFTGAGGHVGIEDVTMLDRRMAIRRRHYPFNNGPATFPWPSAAESADTALRNPRVVPFITHGSQGAGATGFPVKTAGGGYTNTGTYVHGGTTYKGIDRITAGEHDAAYTNAFTRIAALPGPVFFNLWMEMNIPAMGAYGAYQGGTNGPGQASFIAAYRHVMDLAAAAGASNMIRVWCPTAFDPQSNKLTYYPGDAYVDVIMEDLYRQPFNGNVDDIYNFAVAHGKPFGIAEAGYDQVASNNKPSTPQGTLATEVATSMALTKYAETVFYVYWNFTGGVNSNLIDGPGLSAFQTDYGSSNWDAYYGGSAADVTPPTASTTVTALALSAGSIQVSYSGETDNVAVVSSEVWRSTSSGGVYSLAGTDTASPFTDTGLAASTQYFYKLKAVDAANNKSPFSAIANATTQASGVDTTPPTGPTAMTAVSSSSTEIDLTWTLGTDANGIAAVQVYRDGSILATLGAVTAYQDLSVAPSSTHTYHVTNSDPSGNVSTASADATATTPAGGGGGDSAPLFQTDPSLNDTTPSVGELITVNDAQVQGSPVPSLSSQVQMAPNNLVAQIDFLCCYGFSQI